MKRKSVFRISTMATPMMIVCGLLVAGSSAWADDPVDTQCTNRTLLGDYGFSIEGVGGLPPAFSINALRGVAMGHFDGKGINPKWTTSLSAALRHRRNGRSAADPTPSIRIALEHW